MKTIVVLSAVAFASFSLATAAQDNAVISGTVTLKGTPPPETPIDMGADAHCKLQHPQQITTKRFVVGPNGELANVFAYIKEGINKAFDPPAQPVVLDQQKCLYVPYVMGVQAGQDIEIRNSDDTLHNVHATPTINTGFNFAQPRKGDKALRKFTRPEIMVRFKCDVHPWMFAYVGVVSHPFFAVTGSDGKYEIKGLPAGEYTVEVWHLRGGTQTQKVKVGAGEAAMADFVYEVK